MGRTVLAYSLQLQLLEKRNKGFRRALRKEDQKIFDDLLRMGKMQVQAGVMASNPNPTDSLFFSVFIELLKEIKNMKRDMEAKEERLKQLEKSIQNPGPWKTLPGG
ncbi:MAG: hypothetical protein ABUK01_18380 [Leptospirales bacterium]